MAQDTALQVIISIHALREEGDAVSGWATRLLLNFYPRPPRGGRHRRGHRCFGAGRISIHALREEGDNTGDHGRGGRR